MCLKYHKLIDLYKMESGLSSKPEQAGHGSPFISFSTIFNNQILPNIITDKMETSEKEQNKYSVKKGDVLITRTSEILDELAMTSVALKDYPKTTFSGFAKRLRPTENNINFNLTYDIFMAFFFRSNYFRKIVNNMATMTLRASFNEQILSYINIQLPSYEYQVKMGNLLYSIHNQIERNNIMVNKLQVLGKTIYSKNINNCNYYKLKDISTIVTGKEDANHSTLNGKYKFFTCGDNSLLCNDYKFDGKSVLVAGNGNFNVKFYNGKFNAYQRTYIIQNDDIIGNLYYTLFFNTELFRKKSNGSIVKFITIDMLNKIEVPVLSLKINEILNSILIKLNKIKENTTCLINLKNKLLPLLINQQLR